MMDLTLISASSGHGPSTTSTSLSAASTPTGTAPTKRIPASLMKMRRETLAANGKYKLPTFEAGAIPSNSLSLMSVAHLSKAKAVANSTLPVSALVTPRRHSSNSKSFRTTLDKAVSQIEKPDFDYLTMADELDEGSGYDNTTSSSSSPAKPSKGLRRSLSTANKDDAANMDAVLRSGLATPRRTGRRSVGTIGRRRVSRPDKKEDQATAKASAEVEAATPSATVNALLTTPRRSTRKPSASIRRSSSGVNHTSTSVKPSRRSSSTKKESDVSSHSESITQDESVSNGSNHTDTTTTTTCTSSSSPAKVWMCTCGEENGRDFQFCGMCGTTQRWECADCHFANKCKFKFCGMCGVQKKTTV